MNYFAPVTIFFLNVNRIGSLCVTTEFVKEMKAKILAVNSLVAH